jgi:hypothetical protein
MIACAIPPTPNLDLVGECTDMHLILAQEWSDDYVRHYRDLADKGAHIIVDNGAYELGESIPFAEVLRRAHEVKATEVIFPDAMLDAEKSTQLTLEGIQAVALRMLEHGSEQLPFRPFYVPQGLLEVEWRESLRAIVRTHLMVFGDRPFTLGLSKVYADEMSEGRVGLIERYLKELHEKLTVQFDLHLLGWGGDLEEIPYIAREFPWVRSVDTSKPYVWAMAGLRLHRYRGARVEEPHRPDGYFQYELSPDQRLIAQYNLERYRYAADGIRLPMYAE